MAFRLEVLRRPPATADYARPSKYRTLGFVLGGAGLMLATVTLIANIVAADDWGTAPRRARHSRGPSG